jgi:tetratricopeptide (TPR) repeat protein
VKKTVLRILPVCAGPLLFFLLLEGALFLTGRLEPLPVLKKVTYEGREYWTGEPQWGPFILRRPDAPRPHHVWLPLEKSPDELRVVMLGESAVAGFPSEEYSLGRLTRALWNERFPQRPMQMATVALVGVNSHALRQMAIESMQLQPDVLVLYAGHNEVIGPYGPVSYPALGFSSRRLAQLSMAVRNTRTGRALERAMGSVARIFSGYTQSAWSGLDEHKNSQMAVDDPALDNMLAQTRENFRDIIDLALRHGCKVLVCVPAVNLTDWPPMASEVGEGRSAQIAYDHAQHLRDERKMNEAWEYYRRACDLDLMRFRADSRVRQLQRDLVEAISSPDVALVDADLWLHEWNPAFRDDREYFLEHVHLTFEGRVAVSALIADGIAELTGQSPSRGIGRDGFLDAAAWWEQFPTRVQQVKDRVLFTEFDDAYLWDSVAGLLEMDVFYGMVDIDVRKQMAAWKAVELREEGRARWTAAGIETAGVRAAAIDPSDGWIDLKTGENLTQLGALSAARPYLSAARQKYPRLVQAHTALVHQAMHDRQPLVALRHLAELDLLLPDGAKPAELYAVVHLVSGNPAAAVPYLEQIAAKSPDKAGAWLELAKAQVAAGRPKDAAASCRRGLERVGDDPVLAAFLKRLQGK